MRNRLGHEWRLQPGSSPEAEFLRGWYAGATCDVGSLMEKKQVILNRELASYVVSYQTQLICNLKSTVTFYTAGSVLHANLNSQAAVITEIPACAALPTLLHSPAPPWYYQLVITSFAPIVRNKDEARESR